MFDEIQHTEKMQKAVVYSSSLTLVRTRFLNAPNRVVSLHLSVSLRMRKKQYVVSKGARVLLSWTFGLNSKRWRIHIAPTLVYMTSAEHSMREILFSSAKDMCVCKRVRTRFIMNGNVLSNV